MIDDFIIETLLQTSGLIGVGKIERRVCTVYNGDVENKNSYITGLEKRNGIKRLIQIEVYETDKKDCHRNNIRRKDISIESEC